MTHHKSAPQIVVLLLICIALLLCDTQVYVTGNVEQLCGAGGRRLVGRCDGVSVAVRQLPVQRLEGVGRAVLNAQDGVRMSKLFLLGGVICPVYAT